MKDPQATPTAEAPRETTLLELVQSLARQGRSAHEIAATVLELLARGRVVLIGNFRGGLFRYPDDEAGSE
jgi:hypothetical protein